jgi:hypothetical protein
MHRLMRRLIYYCSITPTCFGPLVEAIIRKSQIFEGYKASMAICWNVVTEVYPRRDVIAVGCFPPQSHDVLKH